MSFANLGNTATANFHIKPQDFSPDPKQATINFKKISLFRGIFSFSISIVHFSIFWAENSLLPLECLKQLDSLQSGTEITVWVSLWAAAPWHCKFVCSIFLIAQVSRNTGVRKTTSGLVEAHRKTPLPTYFCGMVQSVVLHLLEGHIHSYLINCS